MGHVFRPVIDGRWLPRHPFVGTAPPQSEGIPLLAGCTAQETAYHLPPGGPALTAEQVQRRLLAFLPCTAAKVAEITAGYAERMPQAGWGEVLVASTSDHLFKRNTYRIAELQAQVAPVHAYHFTGLTRTAPHCAELPFVFGTTRQFVGAGPKIEALSARMMAVWGAFARQGTPGPDWPRTTPAAR